MKRSLTLFNYIPGFLILILSLSGCVKEKMADSGSENFYMDGWKIDTLKSIVNSKIPRKIYFLTPAEGYILSSYGSILHTSDSGKTWVEQNSGSNTDFRSIFFLNQNVGYISAYTSLLKTSDGGNHWSKISYDTLVDLQSMVFMDENNGLSIMRITQKPNSKFKFLVKTYDGGLTWKRINVNIPQTYDSEIIKMDNLYFTIGDGNIILRSNDSGETWQTITTPYGASRDLYNLYFLNSKIAFISDHVKAYKTEDGGSTWFQVSDYLLNFEGIHFINQNEGFNFSSVSVYEGGDFPTFKGTYFYSTKDGGRTFSISKLYSELYLGLTSYPASNIWYSYIKTGYESSELHRFTLVKK
jgi:photosystem II stability/assembly factor-like uncharacterized protein